MQVINGIYTAPPAQRWYPVEIRVDGQRSQVVEVYASNKFDAFHMAISSLKGAEIERAVAGVNLRILSN